MKFALLHIPIAALAFLPAEGLARDASKCPVYRAIYRADYFTRGKPEMDRDELRFGPAGNSPYGVKTIIASPQLGRSMDFDIYFTNNSGVMGAYGKIPFDALSDEQQKMMLAMSYRSNFSNRQHLIQRHGAV